MTPGLSQLLVKLVVMSGTIMHLLYMYMPLPARALAL